MSIQALKDMPLADMRDEVVAFCEAKGWRTEPILFGEAMALLHTEIAEASDAWRHWLLEDATDRHGCDDPQHGDSTWEHECYTTRPPKPEGVGSEFADILIRLLDDDEQFGIELAARYPEFTGAFSINDSFLVNMNTLHMFVAQASILFEDEMPEFSDVSWQGYLVRTLTFLAQLSEHYGIDLMAEYQRKMEYNRSRPYRHGNKHK